MGELTKCNTEGCPKAKVCRRKTSSITFRQKYETFNFKENKGYFYTFDCEGLKE